MQKNDDWRASRVPYLRGLPRPSVTQQRLLELLDKSDKTADELRDLDTLWKAEAAVHRAERAKADARRVVYGQRISARKARTHRLIEFGALVVMSGMDQDRGLVLGALMEIAEQLRQPGSESVANRYKNRGDARLAEQEQLAKKARLRKLTDVA